MNDVLQVEVSARERDVLLRGLRYVRSALLLQMRDPDADHDRWRSHLLEEIQALSHRLQPGEAVDVRN